MSTSSSFCAGKHGLRRSTDAATAHRAISSTARCSGEPSRASAGPTEMPELHRCSSCRLLHARTAAAALRLTQAPTPCAAMGKACSTLVAASTITCHAMRPGACASSALRAHSAIMRPVGAGRRSDASAGAADRPCGHRQGAQRCQRAERGMKLLHRFSLCAPRGHLRLAQLRQWHQHRAPHAPLYFADLDAA